jgi:site-specific DNA-methyltransferase (adenine-specific)
VSASLDTADALTLTAVEATTLDDLEGVIERGLATFVEVGRALERIRDRKLYRQTHSTFEDYCRERWGISRGHAYRQIDAAQVAGILQGDGDGPKMSTRLGDARLPMGDIPASERVARELAPLKEDEAALVETRRELRAEHGENMPTAQVVRSAVRSRAERKQRERDAERRRAEPVEAVTRAGDVEIRHGNLRDALSDLDGQVDAIITDPPYPAEFLDEFDALAELAGRILTPDGVLVAMVGQAHLLDYGERLSRHLSYRWCGAYLTEGPATRVHGRKVSTSWKPLLVFDRGGERSYLARDVFRSVGEDKRHHGWGQSESGTAELVGRFTEAGALVVDPFLGGGTTAVVCRDLGRRFVGCDIDPAAVATARSRVAEGAQDAHAPSDDPGGEDEADELKDEAGDELPAGWSMGEVEALAAKYGEGS